MKEEIWKPIKDYEGLYEISNLGKIKSLKRSWVCGRGHLITKKENILKGELDKDGYVRVSLRKNKQSKKYFVHRLVAQTFIPNPENKPEVNHKGKDGDKTNNKVDNLEWCTRSENELHAYRTGLADIEAVRKANSKPVIQIDKYNEEVIRSYNSIREAEKITGIHNVCISACCKGKTKTAGGYRWRYI